MSFSCCDETVQELDVARGEEVRTHGARHVAAIVRLSILMTSAHGREEHVPKGPPRMLDREHAQPVMVEVTLIENAMPPSILPVKSDTVDTRVTPISYTGKHDRSSPSLLMDVISVREPRSRAIPRGFRAAWRFPPASGESVVSMLKRHKLGGSLILAMIIVATIALVYFGYSRYFSGSNRAGITSLAVLPFTNTGNDPEKEYLSDGISESLINRLSQLPGVKVIANSSSSRYRSENTDPREVATALDVAAVITGRVLKRGDNLLISVELIDGRDRTQLWGQQYNRKANRSARSAGGDFARKLLRHCGCD